MRVVFLGSGEFGLPTLKLLSEKHEVVGVVSQPDRPAGRGGKLTPTPIAAWAAQNLAGKPLIKPENVNEAEIPAKVRGLGFDVMVVIAFGQKLAPPLLDGVRAINLHASLLPRWRGAAPINWAVLGGDKVTGNSVISLADRMDAGLIYAQSRREIQLDSTAGELHDQLSADGPPLVGGVLDAFAAGTAVGQTQDESLKTRAPKLSREMAVIDFAGSPEECRRRINGLSPWPGVTVRFRGEGLKISKATIGEGSGGHAGAILDTAQGLVACGEGVLRLIEVQPPGKRAMAWRDFANGHGVKSQEVMNGGPPC